MRLRAAAIVALLVVATTAISYLPLAANGFVGLDDPDYLTENISVQSGLSAAGVRWAFSTLHTGNWHPLTWISHMTDVQLFGLAPRPHHLVNLGLHLAATALLFFMLRGCTGSTWRSAVAATLFGLHPLHVESVAWASERKDVLSSLLALLALFTWLRSRRRPGPAAALPAVTWFALALLAKPMPMTLPLLLLLLDFWPLGRLRRPGDLWHLTVEKTPFFLLALASAVITFSVQRSAGWVKSMTLYPLPVRVAHALVSYPGYLRATLWPVDLAVPYPHPGAAIPLWQTIGAVVALASVTLLVLRNARRAPYLAVGWFWFLGMLLPVIGLVQLADQGRADRYMYLPLAGLLVALVWGAAHLATTRRPMRPALFLLATIAIVGSAGLTWRQIGFWRDDLALFGHTVRVTRANWLAENNLGIALGAAGRLREAVPHLEEALRLRPDFPDAYNNLGYALERLGRIGDAVNRYREALRLDPRHTRAANNLAAALNRLPR